MTTKLYHDYGTCTTCQAMRGEVARLTAELDTAHRDPVWGILSRQGIERRMQHLAGGYVALALDVDKMGPRNFEYGPEGVDWRMTRIFQAIRSDDTFIGRWKRGDEAVVVAHQDDAAGLAIRLLITFEMHGMSATIIVVPATLDGITAGLKAISVAKQAGQRGVILQGVL